MRLAVTLLLLPSLAACGLLEEIERGIKKMVDCASCYSMLPTFQAVALLGDRAFVNTITTACNDLRIEDRDVCEGAIATQGPILAHDLRHFSLRSQTATKFCEAVFGLCQSPPINEYIVPFPKPAPSTPKVFKSSGRPPVQVVHVSDVHIDRQYTVGAEANCTKPICCRNFDDAGPHIKVHAAPHGNRHCDSPVLLTDSMLAAVKAFAPEARFSIFTGDVVDHAVWEVNEDGVSKDMQAFSEQWAEKLEGPLFPALGNHESAPTNSFPRNTTDHPINSQWVFAIQEGSWSQWIGRKATAQIRHNSGSYSTMAPGLNLKIISLNTVYWYKQNFWLYDSNEHQPDPNGIIAYLVQELQEAEDAGQRAWIIAHMPPGRGDVMRDQSYYFDQVMQRYKNTIAGQYYGHTHKDEFAVGYSNYSDLTAGNAVSVAMIGPALTPMSGNPAFKVYDIDADTFEIIDARTYMSNISDPFYQLHPTWELYYSARETYGPLVPSLGDQSLSPAFWHNLTEVFYANDTAFQHYIAAKSRGAEHKPCRGQCKNGTLCEMRTLRADICGFQSGPVFRIPDPGDHLEEAEHYDSCEGIGIGHILRKMRTKASSRMDDSLSLDVDGHPNQAIFDF
ncbi:predicted protein [Sparassis crispa]|uniref:Sphingomyelin phosphodiesterase n=1 Tax=Sparassis crispa TaxID=139825 RepID=A0A401GHA6_9APHY|nr:predicted protein [Sparassis crispa]GBE81548.1 predicted protein [Sparassis crispa]